MRGRHRLPELSVGTRAFLLAAGWLMVVIGLAGLALPGIQGILTLLLGFTLLSLVSEKVHQLLRRLFSRWPRGWRRVQKLRRSIHRRLAADEEGSSQPSEE
jgi:uncharacterized membrane protein YbaN (DUF454 family)